jgi:hypothetical protein
MYIMKNVGSLRHSSPAFSSEEAFDLELTTKGKS